MKTTIFRWNKIKTLLCLISMFSCQMLFASGGGGNETTYYASLTVQEYPSGAGSVYIIDGNEHVSDITHSTQTESISFQVNGTPNEGYEFNNWSFTSGSGSIDNEKSLECTITLIGNEEKDKVNATVTAYFKRKTILLNTPATANDFSTITWIHPQSGTINIPVTNAINEVDFSCSDGTNLSNTSIKSWSGTAGGDGTVTINATYTLPQDGSSTGQFTLIAAPNAGEEGAGDESNKTYTIDLYNSIDYTPVFTILSRDFSTAKGKTISAVIKPTDFGTLPLDKCQWQASISGTNAGLFNLESNNPTSGECSVTYSPTEIGDHTATLTLTATYTDANSKTWTYEQTCTLNGTAIDDREPELWLKKGDTETNTAQYEFSTTGSYTDEFSIHNLGIELNSISSSNPSLVSPTLSADEKTLILSAINSPSTVGEQTVTITLSGYSTIGTNPGSTVTATLIISIYRWFDIITVTATPDANSMTIDWTSAGPQVTSYQILRGSTILATVDKNTLSYTDTGLTAETPYTYTIKAIASGSTYSESVTKSTTFASFYLTLANCPEMHTITDVDASAAFDSEGKVLMDKLFIMNKKNSTRCHIYDKHNDTSYKLIATVNPTAEEGRAGKIENKKIYIAGTCENLFWNSGDYLGWMQPVNCDIYLDHVRLSAANNEELFTVYENTVPINGDGDANNFEDFSCVYKKASVFYLPENSGNTTNTSTIHLRGKNYLGGNMAGRPKINMDVMGSYTMVLTATVYIPVRYVMSNFSAPIAIKDKKLFTNDGKPNIPFDKNKVWETNIPQITCQIDATWADGNTQSDGYLDLSTRTSTIQDVTKGPLSDGTYHMANRCDVIDGYSEMLGNRTIYPTRIWGYSYLPHLRYEAPLVTGGEHGTFIINGGQINLWPANAYTLDGYIQRSPLAYIGKGIGNMIMRAGKSTNYMACGNSSWFLNIDGKSEESKPVFNESSDGILTFFDNASATCSLYGIGNGLPEGKLIINGGTISAHTDENSYGYTTGQPNVDNATVLNANGTKQPLFGPDVQINGGTFQWPLYGAKNNPHGTGKAFYGPAGVSAFGREFKCHNEFETGNDHGQIRPPYGYNGATKDQWDKGTLHTYANYDTKGNITTRTNTYTIDWTWSILEWEESQYQAINKHNQAVSRTAYSLPEANTDYTAFNEINTTTEPEAHDPLAEEGKKAVMGNAGTDKEYLYGMTNVWSDDKALGYFYLPEERSGIMQNYYIKATDKLTAFTQTTQGEIASTHFPYHLWIDKGGEISVDNNYIIHGRPHYRATYTEDTYQTIAMPFTAKRFFVTDPWDDQFQFYSYVEIDDANAAGVPEADRKAINSKAYCYLYFLDDETTNPSEDADIVHDQRATGVNNTFRSYYHTHTDGSTMQAGKTYVIKFPKVDDANYWGTNTVTLQGEKGQTILGNNNFKLATRPETTPNDTENPTFIMDGNTTFATQDISGKGEVYLVDPAQWGDDAFHATTVSTLAPMQGYLVGSTTTMQRYRIIGREGKVEQTALDQLIHTGWTAVGAHQAMLIMTPQDATAHIYTAEGKLWKTVSLTANTGVIIDAPAGFYIVHAGNDSKKVLVY